jgi:hypothetical protein
VAICTHNDADHANGILGFLEDGLKCNELWLPARWLSALPSVLKPFVDVADELLRDIHESRTASNRERDNLDPSSLEEYVDCISTTEPSGAVEEHSVADQRWPEPFIQMLEQAESWENYQQLHASWTLDGLYCRRFARYSALSLGQVKLLWSAIDAASRIRAIATAAFHRGIPVRWFEFDSANPSGGKLALHPINAREIARVRPLAGPLLNWLALTVSNRESLVYWSPSTKHVPGVLFTADSDLVGFKLPSYLDGSIVTAPHHGSESNRKAYMAVAKSSNGQTPIIWVRSDGRYRSRPGATFVNLADRKFCTICRQCYGGSTQKQAVRFYARKGVWIRYPASIKCSCR